MEMDGQFTTPSLVITRSQPDTADIADIGSKTDNATDGMLNDTMTSQFTTTTTSDGSIDMSSSLPESSTFSSSSTISTTNVSTISKCPDLFKSTSLFGQDARPINITSVVPQAQPIASSTQHLLVNSSETIPGTIVKTKCLSGFLPSSVTYLECQSNGLWNDSLPACHLPSSMAVNTLYFAVIGGVCGLSLLVLTTLYCHLLKSRKKKERPLPPSFDPDRAIYVDPYAIGERLYAAPAPLHYARSDITYAKPKIYSTYLNPSFYEDAYERWRRQEQQVAEKLYDSPWLRPRNSHQVSETSDVRRTQASVKTRGDTRELERFRRLPRAQLSIDQASVKSTNSFGHTQPINGSRGVYGRQGSVLSSHSIEFQNMKIAEPPIGHLVKAFDEAPLPALPPIEHLDMGDGRTPF